jgi:hypothetical protein
MARKPNSSAGLVSDRKKAAAAAPNVPSFFCAAGARGPGFV